MRWIPAGTFVMGSPEGDLGRFEDEGPQHEVVLTQGYWLGETPVTQGLWAAVMETNPSMFKSSDRPVEEVSWEDCVAFTGRLNARLVGLESRLPTEAEWENACRGGTQTATWAGDLEILGMNNAPRLDEIAWYGGNSGRGFDLKSGYNTWDWPDRQYPDTRAGTRRVAQKSANPFGLHDMLGNVWEWCADWSVPYTEEFAIDPMGSKRGTRRILRGGSWHDGAGYVRAASRYAFDSGYRYGYIGFRLARGPSALMPVGPGEAPRGGRRGGAAARRIGADSHPK